MTQRADKAERERDAVRAQVQKDLASVAVTANQQAAAEGTAAFASGLS